MQCYKSDEFLSVQNAITKLELSVRLVRGRRESLVCLSKVVKYRRLTEGAGSSTPLMN